MQLFASGESWNSFLGAKVLASKVLYKGSQRRRGKSFDSVESMLLKFRRKSGVGAPTPSVRVLSGRSGIR